MEDRHAARVQHNDFIRAMRTAKQEKKLYHKMMHSNYENMTKQRKDAKEY